MKTYTGTKTIKAAPMSAEQARANGFRVGDNPELDGYEVEYPDGYKSWSPKTVFDEAYRENGSLTFGDALQALKNGERVSRAGWNGKGMFLFLLPEGEVPKSAIHDPRLREVIDSETEGDTFHALGSIRMWTVDSSGRRAVLTGWLASQSDMLSEDWLIHTD